jgi:replicative DNA helicase
MSEEKIAERIDANMFDVPIHQISKMPENVYTNKIKNVLKTTMGNLIIKEYPTGAAHAGHFRALLNELKTKKKFVPDIVFIDYLNICASSRMKSIGGAIGSYTYIKAIAEELRGLGVEFNVPIVSATQVNRTGYNASDINLEDTSESFGLPATADLMFALISTPELEELNQLMVKQLKNRYNDTNKYKRFIIGIDREKMKLFDAEESAQSDVMSEMTPPSSSKFEDFKI